MGKTALFLAGGAPNMTLTSGALLALHEELIEKEGQSFDIISMAGAGAVVGLMYLSPNGMTTPQALHCTKDFGVSDLIYSALPINYKVFGKSGPSADGFNAYWFNLPEVRAALHQYGMTPAQKLYCDMLLFEGAMMCPTDVNYFSQGFCSHPAYIEDMIDFERLRRLEAPYIEVNAYRLDGPEKDRGPCDFKKEEMTPHHLRAALSFPFIYPPYEINGLHYYEGAAFQVINPVDLKGAGLKFGEIDRFIMLNPMKREFIQPPRNLWDAYAQSIMMPIAALAEFGVGGIQRQLKKFKRLRTPLAQLTNEDVDIPLFLLPYFEQVKSKWYAADFYVPREHLPFVFDWSRSNLEFLFDCGYRAGKELAAQILDPDVSGSP
jgi:predicted acylesterase/phospholipase RssA